MWKRKEVAFDFYNVLLACSDVLVCRCRMQASLIPFAVELRDKDVAVEHLGPGQGAAIEVWVAYQNSRDFSGGTDRANTLHELDGCKAATVPDDYASLGEEEDGGLTDAYGRIELDPNDPRV